MLLHGGADKLQAWDRMMTMFGDDPELANTLEFYDMTPHEMHENLWRRMKVVYEKHRETFFKQSMFKPPHIDL